VTARIDTAVLELLSLKLMQASPLPLIESDGMNAQSSDVVPSIEPESRIVGVVLVPATVLSLEFGSISNQTTSVCESPSISDAKQSQIESVFPPSFRYTAFWIRGESVSMFGSSLKPSVICGADELIEPPVHGNVKGAPPASVAVPPAPVTCHIRYKVLPKRFIR